MEKNPIIVHVDKMLSDLDDDQIRAIYMVVKQIHDLRRSPFTERIT